MDYIFYREYDKAMREISKAIEEIDFRLKTVETFLERKEKKDLEKKVETILSEKATQVAISNSGRAKQMVERLIP